MTNLDRVQAVVAPEVEDLDATLYDIEFAGGLLRVTLDRAGGIDLDTLSEANRRISRALDLADPIPGRYTLEVTSPGLERPLRTVEHFQRAVGERVRIKTRPGADGSRRLEGVLSGVDGERVTVLGDTGPVIVDRGDIERARTVFVWGPAPKPGGPRSGEGTKRPSAKQAGGGSGGGKKSGRSSAGSAQATTTGPSAPGPIPPGEVR